MIKIGKKTSTKNLKVRKKVQESKKKNKKPEENVEKQVIFPRLRLEPRLSIPSPVKNKGKEKEGTNLEKDKRLAVSLNADEVEKIGQSINVPDLNCQVSIDMPILNSPSTSGNTNKGRGATSISALENVENNCDEDFQNFLKSKKKHVSRGKYWTDKEIADLGTALQYCGFNDIKKVADEVKTKTEAEISHHVNKCVNDIRKNKIRDLDPDKRGRPRSPWIEVSKKNLETWPTVRKWKRVAYEEMMPHIRSQDYSRPVITALCNKFYEEEPEPDDAQVINVKLIYKYIADCMAGAIPPQLPPKESALVLDLLREAKMISTVYDFEEERKFLKDFKKTTTFKPLQVKDEFKKKLKQGNKELKDTDAVPVPEAVFSDLSRHRRLMQSFNPLVTPVFMLQKEQEYLEKNFKEPNVYFDANNEM